MDKPSYFPFMHGVYDVKAGIGPLGRDLGNGPADRLVFQLDGDFDAYHAAKRAAVQRPDMHVLRDRLGEAAEQTVAGWMAQRLAEEHPERFTLDQAATPTLDDMALRIQDDLAVLVIDDDGSNRLAYLHVAMPSGWPPEEKIGRPFAHVHAPVPHAEPINAKQDAIAALMVGATRGAVRFAWTVTTDAALNHHPGRDAEDEAPTPMPDHHAGEPLLRVERQVIWGFPEHHASLFLIRTYLYAFDELEGPTRTALAAAVAGMSQASLAYKNMDRELIVSKLV